MKIEESSADFKPIKVSDGNNSFFSSSYSLTTCLWVRFTFLVYFSEGHFAQLQQIISACFYKHSFVSQTHLRYLRSEIFYAILMTNHSMKHK